MCRDHDLQPAGPTRSRTREESRHSWDVSATPSLSTGHERVELTGTVDRGGLGHFGILWANALGAETYAISHSKDKEDEAKKLGAKGFICTKDEGWNEPWKFKFDFIVNCANATDKFDLPAYFSILKVNGTMHNVGFPENPIKELNLFSFAPNGCYMGASHIGNRPEMIAMLELASKKNIKSWVETLEISEEGCKQAVERGSKNDVRYRFTLTGFDKQFGKRT